jgi:hypothetical protein
MHIATSKAGQPSVGVQILSIGTTPGSSGLNIFQGGVGRFSCHMHVFKTYVLPFPDRHCVLTGLPMLSGVIVLAYLALEELGAWEHL